MIRVHVCTCDETTWNSQVPALSKDGKLSMDLFARAVEAVRKDSKAGPVVVVGPSMGAPVILQYARLCLQHVAAMMLAAPESTAVGAMQATFDPAHWGDREYSS